MNKRIIIHLVSVIVLIVGLAMLVSALVSLLMNDPAPVVLRMSLCGVGSILTAALFIWCSRLRTERDREAGPREGFAIVSCSWIAASVFGALPFVFVTGMYFSDALFETVSGFSTTGATVIDSSLRLMSGATLPHGVESLPCGILFWRSLTHWLGGMGIVVLVIAVLPFLKIGGQSLYNAEVTGVKSMDSQLTPRITGTAKRLWGVYLLLTTFEVVLLKLFGMTWFDAVCHSFSTISTGGFSTKTNSIAFYHSAGIDWIIIVFMFLSGCNFVLHYRLFSGRPMQYFKDEEFRFYIRVILISTLVIGVVLFLTPGIPHIMNDCSYYQDISDSLRFSAFQVVAIITSTGFSTADYTLWPAGAGVILLGLMFIGGCGGSTAGGMKCARVLLLVKYGLSEIKRCFFPRMIPDIRLNGTRLEMTTIQKTVGFFSLFVTIYFIFVLLFPLVCGMDMLTALTASATALSNIGPGFGQIGPSASYAWMNPAAKVLFSLEMLIGRLELFTLLVLFAPSFWRK